MTPPELFIASLCSCVGVYAADFMCRHGLSTEGMEVEGSWERAENPARISHIRIQVRPKSELPEKLREPLRRVAESCLIHQTIINSPVVEVRVIG